jgi:predicted Zn finger-like uncharacterized protein
MKITCQACAAKYTIADDKVQGKIVKIRCKKCGATIVVNGNDPSAGADQAGEAARFDYAAQGGGDQWTVNVADGDQRTMTDGEIVDAYHAGVVTDETFCWKDGMGDWLALREIEQLYAQCTATRAMPAPSQLGGPVGAAARRPLDDDDEGEGATKVQESPMHAGGGASRVPQPANGFAEAAPLAARRPGARAPAADLFGSAAQAGSEEDVMTSAPSGMPQPHAGDDKLTGQRNENSVLFSLNALTSKGGPSGGGLGGGNMPAGSEASGLIDIRQLSNQIGIGEDKKKKSRIDDIMNLGGGGAFGPSLGAPILSAPPVEEYAPAPEEAGGAAPAAAAQGKNRMVIFGAIGAGVLVIAGAIGVASMLMKGKDDSADKGKPAASGSVMAATSAAPSASVAAAATDTSAAPSATASAVAPAAATDSSGTAGAAPTSTAAAAATTAKPVATAAAATTTTTAAPATAAATTAPAATTAAPAATAAAAAAGGSDQPFNMGAAKASLGGIAGGAQGCKKGDVSGSGRATVTFAPSGAVQSVTIEGTGFEGTPAGSCVARMFRGARVPPFSGSPFSVRKSFSIN